MRRLILPSVWLVSMFLLASCGPLVTVHNQTSFPVRVIVSANGATQVVSPSPGESAAAEVEEGAYKVTVIPDAEWIEYAKTVRKLLNEQLANADALSGPQLLDVVQRLKDIAKRMQEYEQAGASAASCGGRLTKDNGAALVTATQAENGQLAISCR